jgi:hypothetical protein
MARTLAWSVTALLGLATLAACTTSPPSPAPTPTPTLGTVSGRYIPCTGLGQHTGLQIQAVTDGQVRARTVTGDQGDFAIVLPAGRYDLTQDGSVLASVTVVAGRTTPFSQVSACA